MKQLVTLRVTICLLVCYRGSATNELSSKPWLSRICLYNAKHNVTPNNHGTQKEETGRCWGKANQENEQEKQEGSLRWTPSPFVWWTRSTIFGPLLSNTACHTAKKYYILNLQGGMMVQWIRHWSGGQGTSVLCSVLLLTHCVALSKSVNFFVSQLPTCKMGITILSQLCKNWEL